MMCRTLYISWRCVTTLGRPPCVIVTACGVIAFCIHWMVRSLQFTVCATNWSSYPAINLVVQDRVVTFVICMVVSFRGFQLRPTTLRWPNIFVRTHTTVSYIKKYRDALYIRYTCHTQNKLPIMYFLQT